MCSVDVVVLEGEVLLRSGVLRVELGVKKGICLGMSKGLKGSEISLSEWLESSVGKLVWSVVVGSAEVVLVN